MLNLIGQYMEFPPTLHFQVLHQFPPRLSPPAPSPPTTNLHHNLPRRRHQNVQFQPISTMPLADLILRRITTNPYQLRFNRRHPYPFSLNNNIISVPHKTMADESNKIDLQPENIDGKDKEKEKDLQKSTPAIPPPPEKPLPGDCCGSGCVTCVWDLYYEELEEYNRLYKPNSSN